MVSQSSLLTLTLITRRGAQIFNKCSLILVQDSTEITRDDRQVEIAKDHTTKMWLDVIKVGR